MNFTSINYPPSAYQVRGIMLVLTEWLAVTDINVTITVQNANHPTIVNQDSSSGELSKWGREEIESDFCVPCKTLY